MFSIRIAAFFASSILLLSCGSGKDDTPGGNDTTHASSTPQASDSTTPEATIVELKEDFMTARTEPDNIDSPYPWHGPNGEHWIVTTAKEGHALVIYDANDGKTLKRVGKKGTAKGEFNRPNGVVVIDNLAIVVERDNHRVQVLRLPELTSLGFIGEKELRKPYGLTVFKDASGSYALYVTDNYELVEDQIPPDSALGERVRQYRFTATANGLKSEAVRAFGETKGEGVLRIVESIYADPTNNRVLIAEEDERDTYVKVYSLEGKFTGETLGHGIHHFQTEGIALYACGDSAGYWIVTDQSDSGNAFHIYDRKTLAHLGGFSGAVTANTDGIALTQQGYGNFPQGAFFAVHDDGGVGTFSWKAIASALKLRDDCR